MFPAKPSCWRRWRSGSSSGRASGRGARSLRRLVLPARRVPGRHVAPLQVQRLSRARDRRGLVRAHLAAAGAFPSAASWRVTAAAIVTIAAALLVGVAFNPFLTAKPAGAPGRLRSRVLALEKRWQRFRLSGGVSARNRRAISRRNFPDDALLDLRRKAQGDSGAGLRPVRAVRPACGRLDECDLTSPGLGSVPLAAAGLFGLLRVGAAGPGTALAPASRRLGSLWSSGPACAWIVVTVYLPMAWDRYLLPIQSGNALLAAVGVSCALGSSGRGGFVPGSSSRGL